MCHPQLTDQGEIGRRRLGGRGGGRGPGAVGGEEVGRTWGRGLAQRTPHAYIISFDKVRKLITYIAY
jgi:hypothetical protein